MSFILVSLQETYEAKRKEFLGDLQRKEEEMRQMFVNKVKETEAELKEKEREVSLQDVFLTQRLSKKLLSDFSPLIYLVLPFIFILSIHHHHPFCPPSQLHDKFEQLKKLHQEEKRKVEEKRRDLEEEMNAFNRRKVAAETLSLSQPLKKDKDKKK